MKKKVLSTVGTAAVFGVIVAVIAVFFGARDRSSNLRCDVEKPEGEYDKCSAVADFDDLMPVRYGAFVFDDGAVVDIWEVDPEYWGGPDNADEKYDLTYLSAGKGLYRPSTVYALSTGEILLEVWQSYSGGEVAEIGDEVFARADAYVKNNPPFELTEQISRAYSRFLNAVKRDSSYSFKTLERHSTVAKQSTVVFPRDGVFSITSDCTLFNITPYKFRDNEKSVGHCHYVFDSQTGELIRLVGTVYGESAEGE